MPTLRTDGSAQWWRSLVLIDAVKVIAGAFYRNGDSDAT